MASSIVYCLSDCNMPSAEFMTDIAQPELPRSPIIIDPINRALNSELLSIPRKSFGELCQFIVDLVQFVTDSFETVLNCIQIDHYVIHIF